MTNQTHETHTSDPQVHWYGPEPTRPVPTAPTAPTTAFGTPAAPPEQPPGQPPVGPERPAPRGRRRWVDVGVAALVAAVVAGGTTAGVMSATDDSQPVAASSSTASGGTSAGAKGPVTQAAGQAVDWTKVAGAVEPSVVAISNRSQFSLSEGSGVVLDTKGHVLTNNHVVAGASQGGTLTVTLNDGRSYQASIVGTDPSTDLAVIAMKGATNLTPATLGDSDAVQVGAPVMAVGNPLGLAGTVTTGIVSALDRPVTTSTESGGGPAALQGGGTPVVTNAIQTDAAVNPGNSGGALVDASGRVIGIPSSIASLGQGSGGQSGSIGLGFSIPINEAKSIADQLLADGTAKHPFLGISLKDGQVAQGAAQRAAAVIAQVQPGSPAAAAGLKAGDAIVAVNGESVNSSESLVAQIRERAVGDSVKLTLLRDGKQVDVTAKLTARASQ
jgi:putative serine protease PepD